MPGTAILREKVMSYLSGLSPAARTMLLRKLEAAEAGATLDGEMRVILEAARSMAASDRSPAHAAPPPAATPLGPPPDVKARFFAPYAPFIIDEHLPERQRGWIWKESVDGIWTMLARDVLAPSLVPWTAEALKGLPPPEAELEAAVAAMRTHAFTELSGLLRTAGTEGKARVRLAMRLGGEEALADLADMLALRERLPTIERFLSKLPVTAVPGEASERLLADQIAHHLDERPQDAEWVAAGIVGRLGSASSYFRCAVAVAGSEDVADIRKSPGAVFVDAAFSAAERARIRFDAQRRGARDAAAMTAEIRRVHDVVRAANIAIHADDDSRWRARLVTLRRSMSESIGEVVADVLPAIRRALRLDQGARPSDADGRDAIRSVAVLMAARRWREALAVNELLNRVCPAVEQAIDSYGREMIEHLRKARGPRRDEIHAASEHLLRLAELAHGEEYAALLRKSRDLALNRPAGSSAVG